MELFWSMMNPLNLGYLNVKLSVLWVATLVPIINHKNSRYGDGEPITWQQFTAVKTYVREQTKK